MNKCVFNTIFASNTLLMASKFIYMYILAVYFMTAVRKSAQYYFRAFLSINGRRINYKYIIATNSFTFVIKIFKLYNMEEFSSILYSLKYIYKI